MARFSLDDDVEMAIHIRSKHFDPVRHTVDYIAVGEIVTERIFYSRKEIDGIPAKYEVAIWKRDAEKYPLGENEVWALMFNSLHDRYQAFWLNPERYREAKEILKDIKGNPEEKEQLPKGGS